MWVRKRSSLDSVLVQSLSELNVRAVRVRDERVLKSRVRNDAHGHVELDAFGLQFRNERFQIVDFEPDVIDGSTLRGAGGRLRRAERQIDRPNVGGGLYRAAIALRE
jgi:hypothetical protein